MRNGGAAHQNIEAPQSINNGDARRSADKQVSRLGFPDIDRLTANDKDFSLTLEMTIRESHKSQVTSHLRPLNPEPHRVPYNGKTGGKNDFVSAARLLRGGWREAPHRPR